MPKWFPFIFFLLLTLGSCKKSEVMIPEATLVEVDGGENPVMGDPNAPVTLIAFSDFECTYCKRFYELIENIRSDYINTGQVKYYYRDYPLEKHPEALASAICAYCAGEQGKYWEMYSTLFENQENLGSQSYQEWANALNLDMEAFNECLESSQAEIEVKSDFKKGEEIGVGGTPTFIINNKMYGGLPPESTLRQMLDQAIKEATSSE